jgi:O-antigen/teichoic acid export membrane protein
MLIIFAPVAVHIIYGAKFADSVSVLQAYAFSIPAAFVLTHSFSFYGAKEKPGRQVIIFMVGIVTNSIGMIILYRLFGTVGAAYATAIAYSLMAFLFIKKPL